MMMYRSPTETLAELRRLVAKLEKNRRAYDPGAFAELRRILLGRIATITRELNGVPGDPSAKASPRATTIKRAA